MKIKHNEISIDSTNPFANCKLGREKYANVLSKIVDNYKDGFVLAINNEWGTGKTTFVKMWQKQLESKGFKTLYFNSWENDFETNPLVAIMSELKTLNTGTESKLFKSLITKGAVLTKYIAPQLLKALAQKYVNTEPLSDLIEKTTEGATEILSDEIKEYAEKKKGLKEFKEKLEEFIKESNNNKPLIFIIDELDRCRPNYAVEVLEQIKHLFSVSGIVFVLSIDKTQLGHAVRGFYGSENINADEYLRRFIDVEYKIPEPSTLKYCEYLYYYFDFNSFVKSPIRQKYQEFVSDEKSLLTISSILFEKSRLSLRQQEKIFAHARISLSTFQKNEYVFPDLFITLIFIKTLHESLYKKIKSKEISVNELLINFADLFITKGLMEKDIRPIIRLEAYFAWFYDNYTIGYNTYTEIVKKEIVTYQPVFQQTSKINNGVNQADFEKYILAIRKHVDYEAYSIENLFEKIDMTSDFRD